MFILTIIYALFYLGRADDLKSSLTFVIDNSMSMWDDIDQVKSKTNEVFDAVLTVNSSKIDDFVLVTFNDPVKELRTVTRDKDVFKNALQAITLLGNYDCPEMSMSGIELGLQNSKPNSFLYVFTDASAKDYEKFESIKTLSQKKSIQVTFLLTGECEDGSSSENYVIYDKLAVATSGQVFHIHKQEINKVIDYIINSIKHKDTTLGQKLYSKGIGNNLLFVVDSKEWNVLVSVTGSDPSFDVVDSNGKSVKMDTVTITQTTNIRRVDVGPGTYSVILKGNSATSVKVTASTSVSFQHGFSIIKPTSLEETAAMPVPGEKSYLSIKLETDDKDIMLDTAELRDLDNNIIMNIPLNLIDKEKHFFSTEPFEPPAVMFKIQIHGHTPANEKITRLSTTTVEPQKPVSNVHEIAKQSPRVTILANAVIDVDYNERLVLKCKIHGYPKPDVIWEGAKNTVEPFTVVPIDLPYEYMSALMIDRVVENSTVICKAANSEGIVSDSVTVTVRSYLNVLEYPKDTKVDYGKSVEIKCSVDAIPFKSITWYMNHMEITANDDYQISSDSSILTIKHMRLDQMGQYFVKVTNGVEVKKFHFKITTVVEKPKIHKNITYIVSEVGRPVNINCRILQGIPKPDITWFRYEDYESGEAVELNVTTETLYINNFSKDNATLYSCTAQNAFGRDYHEVALNAAYPPEIIEEKKYIDVAENDEVKLSCTVDGYPTPKIRWYKNNKAIRRGVYRMNNFFLRFMATKDDIGDFTCKATNYLGRAERTTHVNVYVPVKIKSPKESVRKVLMGNSITLPCVTEGFPKPEVLWTFGDFGQKILKQLRFDENNSVIIPSVQEEHEGFYICSAQNANSGVSITYEVHVLVPPEIKSTAVNKNIYAVEGDTILKIPCNATGKPKPTISWKFNGFNVAFGSVWNIDSEGNLLIKNVTKSFAGTYACTAENPVGFAVELYNVNVLPYPIAKSTRSVLLEEGKQADIECDLPNERLDTVRWFKDGIPMASGSKISWDAVPTTASGLYSCRVSGFKGSHSSHKLVTVGRRPIFDSKEETQLSFMDGSFVALSCSSNGEPKPKVAWHHNTKLIEQKSMIHYLKMTVDDIGTYTCEVSNNFGTIKRRFDIGSEECLLNKKNDFNIYQPLILSRNNRWLKYSNHDGFVTIPKFKSLHFLCPNSNLSDGKNKFGSKAIATCIGDTVFNVEGKNTNFKDLKCDQRVTPLAKSTKIFCSEGNTELLTIGFNLEPEFLGVYEVCFDLDKKVPIYTKHKIDQTIASTMPKETIEFTGSKYLPIDFNLKYRCKRNDCCWAKRQMVSPMDMAPGLPQVSTYNNLNTLPQWSTCGAENWNEIEKRIRNLVNFSDHGLLIWTGAFYQDESAGDPTKFTFRIDIKNSSIKNKPKYIWKVIQNLQEEKALAIIQVNIPDLEPSEAYKYVLCKDICNKIEWMRNGDWYNSEKGLTYCCSVPDFNKAFGYNDLITGPTDILNDIHLIPEHTLT